MFLNFKHSTSLIKVLLTPIIGWSVKLGIGYSQMSRLMKPLFFKAAQQELQKKGAKTTDSALSLLSGLHKGDIESFKKNANTEGADTWLSPDELNRIGVSSQLVARWLMSDLPSVLPLKGDSPNFTELAKTFAKAGSGISVRLILQDLERRGLVSRHDHSVELLGDGAPASAGQEEIIHFVGAVRDHMQACLTNIELPNGGKFLEQSLVADGLHPQSAELLHSMVRVWWMKAVREIGNEAVALSERDEPQGGTNRLRVGVYFYSEDANTLHVTHKSSVTPHP